jgi:energy-coupling factor transporter ATP-binding protein EcfA2/ABC-type thiamin/hydroxymethylpyrimidine transport system permease subunit
MQKPRSHFFTLHELLVLAALGALGGVTSSAVSMVRAALHAVFPFPGGMQILAGIHVLWLVVAVSLVPRPGAATAVGLLKGAVELLSGNPRGVLVLAYSGLAGLTVDAVWLLLGRRDRQSTYLLAGGLGAASNVPVLAASASLPGQNAVRGGLAVLASVAFISGLMLAGVLGWWLMQMLRRAGVVGGAAARDAAGRLPAVEGRENVGSDEHVPRGSEQPRRAERTNPIASADRFDSIHAAQAEDGALIRFEQLGWRFADTPSPALSDISLTIQRAEFVAITGPSGSGKSTLALALCGLLIGRHPGEARGRVVVDGQDVASTPAHRVAEIIGLVQQNPDAHFAALTVSDEIAFGMENRCWPPEEIRRASAEAMELLEIAPLRERSLGTLSGGEKQRVAVASMIAGRPAALVLDEPTASLDPEASRALFQALADLCRRTGLTVVIIEHKLLQLLPLKPRLIRLEGGRVVADVPASAAAVTSSAWGAAAPSVNAAECRTAPASISNDPLIELSDVTVKLDGRTILDHVSLRVRPGEVVAVLGPNGGGKTTLLHCLLGLVRPAGGVVRVCGELVSPAAVSRLARQVGLVFQNADHQLVADTVWREALFAVRYLKLGEAGAEQEARRLLEAAGVYTRKEDHPYRLSWGEKRRLNLVSVVLHQPSLLLLDEPFAGQDWENATFLLDAIRGVLDRTAELAAEPPAERAALRPARHGLGACLLITHDPRIVWRSCTRVLFLESGCVVVDAPVPQAFQRLRELGRAAYVPEALAVR